MFKYIAKRIICLFYKLRFCRKATICLSSTILGNCSFEGNNRIGAHNYLNEVSLGLFSNMGSGNQFSFTRIGRFCSVGSNIRLVFSDHPLNTVSTHHIFYKSSEHNETFNENCIVDDRILINDDNEDLCLIIGNDVWIGDNVILKGGIRIGDGAVIGMGSVVTKDVPPYAIVGGNPARLIRYRFEKPIIEQLVDIKWWNWPLTKIREKACLFRDPVELFSELQRERIT